jgi:hypothetical protein
VLPLGTVGWARTWQRVTRLGLIVALVVAVVAGGLSYASVTGRAGAAVAGVGYTSFDVGFADGGT